LVRRRRCFLSKLPGGLSTLGQSREGEDVEFGSKNARMARQRGTSRSLAARLSGDIAESSHGSTPR